MTASLNQEERRRGCGRFRIKGIINSPAATNRMASSIKGDPNDNAILPMGKFNPESSIVNKVRIIKRGFIIQHQLFSLF
jgi:hypothetical protein